MLLQVPAVLTKTEVADIRALIDAAEWVDGAVTAGHQSARAKHNMQLPEGSAASRAAGETILSALDKNPLFIAGALPARIYPPLFNRYSGGQAFGTHVDNAIRPLKGTDFRIRTDLSATLFLTEPQDYEGGELVVEDTYGLHEVKLGAGDLVLYPSSSLHRVSPVTRGARIASFFWIQSLIRDDGQRTLLFDMDLAIQRLSQTVSPEDASIVSLTGAYHNLLRMWAEP
jgi:PKHD-type hydroxylase